MTQPPLPSGPHDPQPYGQLSGGRGPFAPWQPYGPPPGFAGPPGQQADGRLPGYPGPPPPSFRLDRPVVPGTVTAAFVLYLLSAVLGVVSQVLASGEDARADARRQFALEQPDFSSAELEAMVRTGVIIGVVVMVLFSAFAVFLAFKMRTGRDWARVVSTVLSGLGIAAYVGVLAASPDDLDWIITVDAGLCVVAVVLMYLARSNRYFRDCNQFRAQLRAAG